MLQVREVPDNFMLSYSGKLGTICAKVACLPSKILIEIVDNFHRRHVWLKIGIHRGEILTVDGSQALSHVRRLRDEFVNGIAQDLVKPLGDKYIQGYTEFTAPNVLKFAKNQLQAKRNATVTG